MDRFYTYIHSLPCDGVDQEIYQSGCLRRSEKAEEWLATLCSFRLIRGFFVVDRDAVPMESIIREGD